MGCLVMDPLFYKGKKVLITGHTGFKGSWLSKMLIGFGAELTGYSLLPPTQPNLFDLSGATGEMHSVIGDIRDLDHLQAVFSDAAPEIVIHMAAQPLVRDSYQMPRYTYETNVMGTVNILECIRKSDHVRSFLNVTTDKVYLNREWDRGYREDDPLDGYDPYSNSKSCSEILTNSYASSFFSDRITAISTARAGNVIGGGDFAKDRIIPDCVRAAGSGTDIIVRNPYSTRPYQHVLEPLYAYLMIVQGQYENIELAGCYNVGPDDCDCVATGDLADLFCRKWNESTGAGLTWKNCDDGGPHEAQFLKLDCAKLKSVFGWTPQWHIETAVAKTVEWTKAYYETGDSAGVLEKQIKAFLGDAGGK
jgi:CDP-glucose 4,6-dehydratase